MGFKKRLGKFFKQLVAAHVLITLLICWLFSIPVGLIYLFGFWWLTFAVATWIVMRIGGDELRQKLKNEAEEAQKEAEASGKA